MDTPGPPPNGADHEGNAPPDIEAMAERAVADFQAGQEDDGGVHVVNMDTESTTDIAAGMKPPSFENKPPDASGQSDDPLNLIAAGQGEVHRGDIQPQTDVQPPPTMNLEPLTPVAPPAPATPATETPADAPVTDKSKKSHKRKTARTVRRVLVAKKEMDAATQVMTGLRDISKVLDPEDAKFLGEEYWVFTQHQLAWLIASVNPPKDGDVVIKVGTAQEETKPTEVKAEEKMDVDKESTPTVIKTEQTGTEEVKMEVDKESMNTDIKTDQNETEEVKMVVDKEETGEARPPTDSNAIGGEEKPKGDGGKVDWKARRDMLLAKMASGLRYESEKVVTAAVQDDAGEAKQISIASREDAEKRLAQWEEKLKAIGGNPFQVEEESFSLDGPMKFLLPKGFKNFLDSIDVKTLYQFLSLKKTETGALCELYALWRHTCKLPRVTAPAVVRYFLGIHARMEGAVTAVPPCDEKQRKWMNNTIVVMTGAALEFLVEDRGIFTARDFVDARTKDLSMQLAAWRDSKKLEPLKGSGKFLGFCVKERIVR